MLRPALEEAIRAACDELSSTSLEMRWVPGAVAIEAIGCAGDGREPETLARCELERTTSGLVARQQQLDAHGRPLEHGFSLVFSRDTAWRRWTDGAELTDDDLGAELVGWTFRLAMDRATTVSR